MSAPLSLDYGGKDLTRVQRAGKAAIHVLSEAGFATVDPGQLLDAENLLDLYGEDVRGRAFVFGAGGQEMCLRPDLTLPICRYHLMRAAATGKYAASGPVFRQASRETERAAQFMQVGAEWFGAENAAKAEAEMFAHAQAALTAAGAPAVAAVTGDLGVLFALIDASPIPERWRARLKRHIWRPSRFHALLEGFASETNDEPGRAALLRAIGGLDTDEAHAAVTRMLTLSDTPHIGLRGADEIAERFLEQAADSRAHPLPREIVEAIESAATLKGSCGVAVRQLRELARGVNVKIDAALAHFEARLEALDAAGIDAAALPFDGEFGRNLEYYDGFVFEFYAPSLAAVKGRHAAQLGGGGSYNGMLGAAATAFGTAAPSKTNATGFALRPESIIAAQNEATS